MFTVLALEKEPQKEKDEKKQIEDLEIKNNDKNLKIDERKLEGKLMILKGSKRII